MNRPFVSVIIPNYCHAQYLHQRIQSVLNQTYLNFEVIILDDYSCDDGASKLIIESYRSNPHISHIVYNDSNSGSAFRQWKRGFQMAEGELIWIAESDDYCDLNFLEILVSEFEKDDKLALAFFNSLCVDRNGLPISMQIRDANIYRTDGMTFIKQHMILWNTVGNASAALFRKKDALSIDQCYTNYKSSGDKMFWIEICECGNVVHHHAQLNYFRRHENSVTFHHIADGTTAREDFKIFQYCRNKGYIDTLKYSCYIRDTYLQRMKLYTDDKKLLKRVHVIWDPYHTLLLYRILSKIYHKIQQIKII